MSILLRLLLLLILLKPDPLQEDAVDGALESAQVKARAGKVEEALATLDGLVKDYDSDPRIHYHRSLFLQQLSRLGASTDAIERAEETLGARLKAGEKSEKILAVKDLIIRRADDLLVNRRTVRTRLIAYRTKCVSLAEALCDAKHPEWAGYVIQELRFALENWDDDLTKLDQRASKWEGAARSDRNPSDGDTTQAEKNVADAQKSLRAQDYKEARLSALAALERVPGHFPALGALGEALVGLKKPAEAVVAFVGALDAPKRSEKDLAGSVRRIKKALRELSSQLADFVDERTDAAETIVATRKRASKAGRAHDVAWIDELVRRMAPAEVGVEAAIGVSTGKRPDAKAGVSDTPSGFKDLTGAGIEWTSKNNAADAVGKDGEIVLALRDDKAIVEATPKGIDLPDEFVLRFQVAYEISEKQEPWIFVIFGASSGSGNEANGLMFFPEGDHTVAFASRPAKKGWALRNKESLPKGKLGADSWCDVEITWSESKKRLHLAVGGAEGLDIRLEDKDSLNGAWSFGLGGAAKSVRFRRVLLKTGNK